MDKPEALRLAEALDAHQFDEPHATAAELLRLHAENERLQEQHDVLLEALKTIKDTKRLAREMQQEWCPAAQGMVRIASAAIKAVEGEK